MQDRERALVELAGPARLRFLVILAYHVVFRGRGEYIEAGYNTGAQALASLRAINEVMLVIAEQLKSSMSGKPAYPDDAFLQVIFETAAVGGSEYVMRDALSYALKEARGEWPQAVSSSPSGDL